VNYVRPLGTEALGLSCGLKGTGMCFSAELLHAQPWDSYSLIEIRAAHQVPAGRPAHLLRSEAYLESHMPTSLRTAESQNMRWESGKIALVREYAGRLLREGLRTGNSAVLHDLVALLMPPLSILAAALAFGLGVSLLAGAGRQQP